MKARKRCRTPENFQKSSISIRGKAGATFEKNVAEVSLKCFISYANVFYCHVAL